MADKTEDPQAARRNATAALIRAFAWPIVVVGVLFFYNDTIRRIALGTQEISVAGVEIKRWRDESTLSDTQRKKLEEITPGEVMEFFARYSTGSRHCIGDEGARDSDKIFESVGLIEARNGDCSGLSQYYTTTLEGKRLAEALLESLKSVVVEQFLLK